MILCALAATTASAQGGYYNLDSSRPTRIEDAAPTPLYELELQLAPVRFEKLATGVHRWRIEPKMSYGVAPFTAMEIRAPLIIVNPPDAGAPITSGVGGLAIGAQHAFGVEKQRWPALALAAEWIAPVGSLGAYIGSYSVKGIATKTFPFARLHINALYGTYSSRVSICSLPRPINIPAPPGCPATPLPFDPPCDVIPANTTAAHSAKLCSARPVARLETPEFDPTRSVGLRWMTGLGIDRAFALSSTLVTADVVAERFAGLFARTDLSAEIGVRRQITPQVVLDLGVTRHFVGLVRSNAVNAGIGYGVATPRFLTRRAAER